MGAETLYAKARAGVKIMIGSVAAIVYGILSIVGGLLGYVKANSKVSLISGIISGLVLVASGLVQLLGVIPENPGQSWVRGIAIGVTVILTIVFVVRFQKTRKWMPAGMMVVVGVAALIAMVV